MAEASEFISHPGLLRQRSLSDIASPHSRSRICCMGGRLRGKSLADFEFSELFSDCKGFFSNGGERGARKGDNGRNDDSEEDYDDLHYRTPSRWKLFCRKVKAEARKNMRRPTAPHFQYDALSYAMNFDNGMGSMRQRQEEGGMALHLQSARFSGPILSSAAGAWRPGVSAQETLIGTA